MREEQIQEAPVKVLLVGVDVGEEPDFERSMEELASLAEAAEKEVAGQIVQRLDHVNKALYIGTGKVTEVRRLAEECGAQEIVFDNSLTPSQVRNLGNELELPIIDRTNLILDIFAIRAQTREAKLQVETARLQYMLPRLVGMYDALSRQGGASGSMSNKGTGEKKLELDRRKIEHRITELKKELEDVGRTREVQRKKRQQSRIPQVALVGYTNAGKSTILNLVIGFNQAESGKVLIDGKDISKIDLRTYRKHLAVVPQTSILFSGTIRDNITYGCENVSEEELQKVIKAANLSDLIASLPKGLDTMVGEHGGKLSGGQRQRISIARALIRDPKVIVLDEATSALDSISEKLIQQALNNLTEGRTTFIVAHRLSTIRDADRIAVIADGHCSEYGTYDELMALKGEFYQLKQIQS